MGCPPFRALKAGCRRPLQPIGGSFEADKNMRIGDHQLALRASLLRIAYGFADVCLVQGERLSTARCIFPFAPEATTFLGALPQSGVHLPLWRLRWLFCDNGTTRRRR